MTELKQKILAKMKQPNLSTFATVTEEGKPWVRYVVTMADDDLNVWFATFAASRKVGQVAANPEVHLTLGVTELETAASYVQVQGTAQILTDADTKKAIWYDHLANIFSGPEDPNYVVCKVTPYRIEFNTMTPGVGPEVWEA
jgi:general stress protein 26